MVSGVKVTELARNVYAIHSGAKVFVIERARFVLRRGGRFLQHWLKYLSGIISTTGERILVCLGEAARLEIESWLRSHNGAGTLYVYRLFEHMLRRLGIAKCLAIALIALKVNHG